MFGKTKIKPRTPFKIDFKQSSGKKRKGHYMAKVKTKNSRQIPGNISLEVWYRNELLKMLSKISKATEKEILKVWKTNTPKMTLQAEQNAVNDSSPAVDLAAIIRRLKNYFDHYFYELEPKVARKFTERAKQSATVSLKNILKEEGFTVNFHLTRQMNDILQATVAENVNLIKSIHTMYFDQVQTVIMQAVKNGRDMEYIRKELTERFGVSERKAKIIARDQTNKAMQSISRARALETGITKARWVHIPGAKTSRETHKHFDGKPFDLNKGRYDKDVGRYVQPGELINCNCRFRLIVPSVEK